MSKEVKSGIASLLPMYLSDAEAFNEEWSRRVWTAQDYPIFLYRLMDRHFYCPKSKSALANNEAFWRHILMVSKGGFTAFERLLKAMLAHFVEYKLSTANLCKHLMEKSAHPYACLLVYINMYEYSLDIFGFDECRVTDPAVFEGLSVSEITGLIDNLLRIGKSEHVLHLLESPSFISMLTFCGQLLLIEKVLLPHKSTKQAALKMLLNMTQHDSLDAIAAMKMASILSPYHSAHEDIVSMLSHFDLGDFANQSGFKLFCRKLQSVQGAAEVMLLLLEKDASSNFVRSGFEPALFDLLAGSEASDEVLAALTHDGEFKRKLSQAGANPVIAIKAINASLLFYQNVRWVDSSGALTRG